MNSAALPDTAHLPMDSSPWADVRRVFRRICVLRATGHADEASTLEHTDLARALAAARLATEDPSLEHTVLAEEASRVANAETLAELVTPLLAERLRQEIRRAAIPAQPPPAGEARSAPAPATPDSPSAAPTRGSEAPPIADLIESMLSQQPPGGPAARSRRP